MAIQKIVTDKDTDTVYVSYWLKRNFSAFFSRFVALLNSRGIPVKILRYTADIWTRDYMPIQIYKDLFIQYRYNPDYLQNKEDRQYITDTNKVCDELKLKPTETELVIDGGNVVKVGQYVIMTEKVYHENPSYKPAEIRNMLKQLFHAKIIMFPWDREEKYGHADGIVRGIDDNTVLLTNYSDYDANMANRFEEILSKYFIVKKLKFDDKNEDNWAYINSLRIGNTIIIPGLGIANDKQALSQFQEYYPSCNILQINCPEIVAEGGALNCITWNIAKP